MSVNPPHALSRSHLQGFSKLLDVTCRLAVTNDLDEILELVTSETCTALGCERASLFLVDEATGELYTRFATELEIEEIRTSINDGITGWVARHRAVANIPDPASDDRWNSHVDRETGFRTRNILAAPALSVQDGRLLGVLEGMNKLDGVFDAVDEQLLQAFAAHAASALERAALLRDARRTQELELSLEVGRRIQAGFLPDRLPDIPGYEVAALWEPAEGVGGDYYDLIDLRDGRLGLVVADVSGHGIGASLIMASVRAMLHVLARTIAEPDRMLSLLAESIDPDLKMGRFITMLMVSLDLRQHTLSFANAGHGPALHFRRKTGEFHRLASTGPPIGFETGRHVPLGPPVDLLPGDLLILATDGAVEHRDAEGKIFGSGKLQDLIRENRTLSAPALRDVLRAAIHAHFAGLHPPDDVTLLIVERKLS